MTLFGAKGYELEEGIGSKVRELPARTPPVSAPTLENISELVGRGVEALTDEHANLLTQAQGLFEQVETCVEVSQNALNMMIKARKEFCEPKVEEPQHGD